MIRVVPEGWTAKFFEAERIRRVRPAYSVLEVIEPEPQPVVLDGESFIYPEDVAFETEVVDLQLYHRPAISPCPDVLIPGMTVCLGYSSRAKTLFYWYP